MPYNEATGVYTSKFADVEIPVGLSIYDFLFEPTPNINRPERKNSTWLIDSKTGRTLSYEQTKQRTLDIAAGFSKVYGLTEDDVVAIFSGNEVDYATAIWATFRLDAIVSAANPSYTSSELAFQLKLVQGFHKVKILLIHPESIVTAKEACTKAGLSESMIVLICKPDPDLPADLRKLASGFRTLDDIIELGRGAVLPPKSTFTAFEKLAFLSFSSGTTGLPKAVAIAHHSVINNVLQSASHYEQSTPLTRYDINSTQKQKGDIILGCLPFYHIYGLVVVLHLSIFQCCPVVTLNKFTLPAFLETIQRHKISVLYVVPPIIIQLVKNPLVENYDLSSMKMAMTGAAPLTEDTFNAVNKKFPSLLFGQGYGMTETSTIISIFDATKPIVGASAGILAPNVRGKIVSAEGKCLPPGIKNIGELWSKSPSNALGYLGNEKATKETFDSEGFVHTGDECYIDSDGNLFVVDRIKELIKVLGNQVAPAELEGLLLEHPDVLDCCVIGIYSEKAGEVPKAYVALTQDALAKVKSGGATASNQIAASIMKLVSDNKISYKHVKTVEFIDAIPKTASGKLLRKDLRVMHAASEKAKSKL